MSGTALAVNVMVLPQRHEFDAEEIASLAPVSSLRSFPPLASGSGRICQTCGGSARDPRGGPAICKGFRPGPTRDPGRLAPLAALGFLARLGFFSLPSLLRQAGAGRAAEENIAALHLGFSL